MSLAAWPSGAAALTPNLLASPAPPPAPRSAPRSGPLRSAPTRLHRQPPLSLARHGSTPRRAGRRSAARLLGVAGWERLIPASGPLTSNQYHSALL